jgi:Domain of unknown function (DUF397)
MRKPAFRIMAIRPAPDLAWDKSSLSCSDGNCVEMVRLPHGEIVIRDRGGRDGAVRWGWRTSIGNARDEEFRGWVRTR